MRMRKEFVGIFTPRRVGTAAVKLKFIPLKKKKKRRSDNILKPIEL